MSHEYSGLDHWITKDTWYDENLGSKEQPNNNDENENEMDQDEFNFEGDGKPQSLIHHPLWPELRSYVRVQHVRNDTEHGRARIEVTTGFPYHLRDMRMRCVYCGAYIYPLRQRKGESKRGKKIGRWFIAVTCELKDNVSCSRSGQARDEYIRIVDDKRRST